MAKYSEVPSILIVAPNGKTNDEVSLETSSSSSTTSKVIGKVAIDDEVERATICALEIFLINFSGFIFEKKFNAIEVSENAIH